MANGGRGRQKLKTKIKKPLTYPIFLHPPIVLVLAMSGDFNACTVHQVSSIMVIGSPASQQAALAVLENPSSSLNNISKTLVQSAVDCISITGGMSQAVAKTLLKAEKLRLVLDCLFLITYY